METPMTQRPGEAYALFFGEPEGPATHIDDLAPGSPANPYLPNSVDEAETLPSGAHFVDPFGTLRVRH
jgi:hypothetical protein